MQRLLPIPLILLQLDSHFIAYFKNSPTIKKVLHLLDSFPYSNHIPISHLIEIRATFLSILFLYDLFPKKFSFISKSPIPLSKDGLIKRWETSNTQAPFTTIHADLLDVAFSL